MLAQEDNYTLINLLKYLKKDQINTLDTLNSHKLFKNQKVLTIFNNTLNVIARLNA